MKKAILISTLLILSIWLGDFLKPTKMLYDQNSNVTLEEIIPKEFSGWRVWERHIELIATPKQKQVLEQIYSDLLERTYVNKDGNRVMLSIAYGSEQANGLAVHFPEACYPAQGFDIVSERRKNINFNGLTIPVKKLETQYKNFRHEPVTYWIRNGDFLIKNAIHRRLVELQYGLSGYIPDGLLFRVSSIGKDSDIQFMIQEQFIRDLFSNISEKGAKMLLGSEVLSK